ncbi:MAG: transglycosylase SLT domain-containing protein [Candidatus Omnitrophica bacterium]|nr:transglycosylase SLT domain-containing protein [Candidatus Omnitrophota bacterium]
MNWYNTPAVFRSWENGENPPAFTPTPTPTPTPIPTPTYTPKFTLSPEQIQERERRAREQVLRIANANLLPEIVENYPEVPYYDMIKRAWPGVNPNIVANLFYKESSLNPRLVHINEPLYQTREVESRKELEDILSRYPSVDIGLSQVNTNEAMTDYLNSLGLTYWDLIENPELNAKIGYDLFIGNIPRTSPGFSNWVAAQSLGY